MTPGDAAASTGMTLEFWDWAVVAVYMAVVFAIAWWAMRKVRDTGGLLLGKRKMGGVLMVAASFAGGTNANHPISVASATFEKGLSGVWLSLSWMLITPFFWVFPPALRRLRIVTLVDVVRMRVGRGTRTGHQRLLLCDWIYLPGKLRRGEVRWKEYAVDLWGLAGSIAFVVLFLIGLEWLITTFF